MNISRIWMTLISKKMEKKRSWFLCRLRSSSNGIWKDWLKRVERVIKEAREFLRGLTNKSLII